MMDRLVLWQGVFYEGDESAVRQISPLPVISPISCEFIDTAIEDQVIFREESFDPVTRIRRGRLYFDKTTALSWGQVMVDNRNRYNWGNLRPEASYESWKPGSEPQRVIGRIIRIGSSDFATSWRIIGTERITIGHVLLTLRANSLLGVIPELLDTIAGKDGSLVKSSQVKQQLDALVDALHRQQATPTADVAREVAKVILTEWIGDDARGKDLGAVIRTIPEQREVMKSAASIVNRLHPRGKSSEREVQAAQGATLRAVTEEDAEVSVHLVGMLLREIGWAAS